MSATIETALASLARTGGFIMPPPARVTLPDDALDLLVEQHAHHLGQAATHRPYTVERLVHLRMCSRVTAALADAGATDAALSLRASERDTLAIADGEG